MKNYYVNKKAQANGDHEVHHENCIYLPDIENRKYLGIFSTCKEAVKEAKKIIRKRMDVKHALMNVIQVKK